jgi:four helix bundle protein
MKTVHAYVAPVRVSGRKCDESVKELDVLKISHPLVLIIYRITYAHPEEVKSGLVMQMRRAAYSIPLKLAEGTNRPNKKESRQLVGVAKGPAGEV